MSIKPSQTNVVFDFDRVLYNTEAVKGFVREELDIEGLCPKSVYDRVYAQWTAIARDTQNIDELSIEKQKEIVCWANGFGAMLAKEIAQNSMRPERDVFADIFRVHEVGLNHSDFVYPEAFDLLRELPKKNRFIFTAGGEFTQGAKLRASGIYELIEPSHVAVVPAKTNNVFQTLLANWNIGDRDFVIHVNDRYSELVALQSVHPNMEPILALWSRLGEDVPAPLLPNMRIARTFGECRTYLEQSVRGHEGVTFPSSESRA